MRRISSPDEQAVGRLIQSDVIMRMRMLSGMYDSVKVESVAHWIHFNIGASENQRFRIETLRSW